MADFEQSRLQEEVNGGATTGKWDRMKVAGPGIGKEYKPAWLWLSSESSGKHTCSVQFLELYLEREGGCREVGKTLVGNISSPRFG
jgi:hypothetical protein